MKLLLVLMPSHESTLIVGPPGVGKTDIVIQACERLGVECMVVHPVVSDPTDIKGLPFVVDGKAQWLPFGDLLRIIQTKKELVVFIDDLGQAPPTVQASWMQLLLLRRLNEFKVSDKVTFVAATNRKSDKAGVSGILEPVKSRFVTILYLRPDKDDWVTWAMKNNMPGDLIGYVNFRPEALDKFEPTAEIINTPCARTLAHVGRMMKLDIAANAGVDAEFAAFAGAVGTGVAGEIQEYQKVWKKVPDVNKMLDHPNDFEPPEEVGLKYAYCTALAYEVDKPRMGNFIKIMGNFEPDFANMALRMATDRDRHLKKCQAFIEHLAQNTKFLV